MSSSTTFEPHFCCLSKWTFLYHKCLLNPPTGHNLSSFRFCVLVKICRFNYGVFRAFLFQHLSQLLTFLVYFCDLLIDLHTTFCSLLQFFLFHSLCNSSPTLFDSSAYLSLPFSLKHVLLFPVSNGSDLTHSLPLSCQEIQSLFQGLWSSLHETPPLLQQLPASFAW